MTIIEGKKVHVLTMRDQLKVVLYRDERGEGRMPLLLVHGFAEHMGRYARLIDLLRQQGLDVWGYDARGHGLSEGARGVIPYRDALVDDLVEVFQFIERITGRAPLFLAHSMGGLTAALAVAEKRVRPAGLVLSSPALRVRMSVFQTILLNAMHLLMPTTALKPPMFDASLLSHDPDVGVAYERDPLVFRQISALLARFMLEGGRRLDGRGASFDMPVLLQYAGSDEVVDPVGSDDFASQLAAQPQAEVHRYDKAFHEIFNETATLREPILKDLTDWLKKREFVHEFP